MNIAHTKQLIELAQRYGTPLWVYNADIIKQQIAKLRQFDVIRYAQKANSNIHILRFMQAAGVKVDAVSLGEIERALYAGYLPNTPEPADIIFTADILDRPTLQTVVDKRIVVNAGSIDMLRQLGECSPHHPVWIRINPGFGHGHNQKTNTGGESSKHGIWHESIAQAIAVIRTYKLNLIGVHMHIGSGVDYQHLEKVCGAMVNCVLGLGHDIEAISAGGGLSTPYQQEDPVVDTHHYFATWDTARAQIAQYLEHPIRLEIEPGRFLVAQSGQLIAEVRATKQVGERCFALVDAGFNDLMRPSLYGSYHGISVLDAQGHPKTGVEKPTVVAGPLCEAGDVFTQHEGGWLAPRLLPEMDVGDYLVFHDTGAYGASMSSNYNSRPLAAEVLIQGDQVQLIRRRQTIAELMALEET